MQAELPSTNIVTRPQQATNGDGHGNPLESRCRVPRKEDLGICQNEKNIFGRTQKSKEIAKWPVPKAVRREVLRDCLGRTRVPLHVRPLSRPRAVTQVSCIDGDKEFVITIAPTEVCNRGDSPLAACLNPPSL